MVLSVEIIGFTICVKFTIPGSYFVIFPTHNVYRVDLAYEQYLLKPKIKLLSNHYYFNNLKSFLHIISNEDLVSYGLCLFKKIVYVECNKGELSKIHWG